jgi:hypothetical protein
MEVFSRTEDKSMSPVTRNIYNSLRKSIEGVVAKNPDSLLSRSVPVNVIVAREIGLVMDAETVSAYNKMPARGKTSAQATFALYDVVNAIEKYGEDNYGLPGLEVTIKREEDEELGELIEIPSEESTSPIEEGSDDE